MLINVSCMHANSALVSIVFFIYAVADALIEQAEDIFVVIMFTRIAFINLLVRLLANSFNFKVFKNIFH